MTINIQNNNNNKISYRDLNPVNVHLYSLHIFFQGSIFLQWEDILTIIFILLQWTDVMPNEMKSKEEMKIFVLLQNSSWFFC